MQIVNSQNSKLIYCHDTEKNLGTRLVTNLFKFCTALVICACICIFCSPLYLALAKNRHAFSRARYRGLAKVQIQVYMVSAVQNLKRILYCLFHVIQRFISCLVYDFKCYSHYLLVNHYFCCLS